MAGLANEQDAVAEELVTSIIPHVGQNFRVLADRGNRAMAGLFR